MVGIEPTSENSLILLSPSAVNVILRYYYNKTFTKNVVIWL